MSQYNSKSLEKLSMAHQDLQTLFHKVIQYFDNTILCSVRTEEEQNIAFHNGVSKKKYPNSLHNQFPSLAIDVIPYPINWEDKSRCYYFGGFVKGIAAILKENGIIKHDIRWGGDWNNNTQVKDESFEDLVHFEITGFK